MKIIIFTLIALCLTTTTFASYKSQSVKDLVITPINHGSFQLDWGKVSILVDPVGDFLPYKTLATAQIILLTDIHPDHLDLSRLKKASNQDTTIIAPQAVINQLKKVTYKSLVRLDNNQSRSIKGVKITAMPMYNMLPEKQKFHPKGRGNGYLLEMAGKRVYISGDTEDIPEMRSLKNIDVAFICMNLPYTMNEQMAASATLAFKPKEVYPFHYRGKKDGQPFFHDVKGFKSTVESQDRDIHVHLLEWY